MERNWNLAIRGGTSFIILFLLLISPITADLMADFSANTTSGEAPLSIEFYDQSSGNVTSWNWSFGDGSISGEQNPVHTFIRPGAFTVELTVSDGNESDFFAVPDFITAKETDSGDSIMSVSITDQPPEGTLSLVTVLTPWSSQYLGDIDGDTMVFMDDSSGITRVKRYNFDTGIESFIPPVHHDSEQANPAISGELLVWEEIYCDPMNYFVTNYSVILHDLVTNESFVISEFTGFMPSSPDIFENKIVWQEYSGQSSDIYLFDADIGEKTLLTPDTEDSDEMNPVIFGDRVVYECTDIVNGTTDIQLLNLSTDELRVLTPDTYFSNEKYPSIWGDYIIYSSYDEQYLISDIYLYNSLTENTILLTPDSYDTSEEFPSIYGDRVAWQGMDFDSWTYDIFVYDIATGIVTRYSFDTPYTDESNPAMYEDRVVWEQFDYDTWMTDIYSFTIGTELPPLEADFSVNATMGTPPLTVAFTDLSTGSVEGWHWDFGDGTRSTEQNPVHTYTDPGTYAVTLIIHNSAQRTGMEIQDLVCAGVPPRIQFVADPVEGSKPLSVQFSDLSANNPTRWNWSFGDGSTSTEKNPIRVYQQPGVYNVTLTAGNQFGDASHTETNYICVMDGVVQDTDFSIPGITILSGDPQSVIINTTLCTPGSGWNQTWLPVRIPSGCGVDEIVFYSMAGEGFHQDGDSLISGTICGAQFKSSLTGPGITPDWSISCCLNSSTYPVSGLMKTEAWENTTESDYWLFRAAAIAPDYENPQNTYDYVPWVAYTVRFRETDISSPCNATLILGINATWVSEYGWGNHGTYEFESNMEGAKILIDGQFVGYSPLTVHGLTPGEHVGTAIMSGFQPDEDSFTIVDERDSIHVIRIGDDGSSEVLDTRFLYHDPATNMDYFQAESPAGLSTFGVAALSKSGNPLQLLYLTIVKLMGGTGGGGGGSSSVSSMPGENPTPFATIASASVGSADVLDEQTPSAPKVTKTQAAATVPPQTPDVTSTDSQLPITEVPSMLIILKNLSVVFVVVLVSLIFYIRWRRREGGD